MLEVRGFRGFRFAADQLGCLDSVITPPYDVISPEDRQKLASRSASSMVHVILPVDKDGKDKYQVAADTLQQWINDGILKQDANESLYLLRQTFADENGNELVRRGFLGATRIPEPDERLVLGHERTFERTVGDRLHLTESTRFNLGPVFVLYSDPENSMQSVLDQMNARPPDAVAHTLDGVTQEIWRVDADPAVTEFFADKRLYIADGHHRYRTACVYRDEMRARECPQGLRPYDYVMMGFVALNDPGLVVYPTHRLLPMPEEFNCVEFLNKLSPWFDVEKVDGDLQAKVEQATGTAIGVVVHGDGSYLMRLREECRDDLLGGARSEAWRALDVAVLHSGIVERAFGNGDELTFTYERSAEESIRLVVDGKFGLAFILKTATADQIRACAEAGENMPHKSTYFFPKLPTGAAINRLY